MSHLRVLAGATPIPISRKRRITTPGTPLLRQSLSRRRLLRAMAGVGGAALVAGNNLTAIAHAGTHTGAGAPTPIPGGFEFGGQFLHVFLPNSGGDEATIFDFNGFLGSTLIRGQGTDGDGNRLGFHADMRLMDGLYVGVDGKRHRETFAFV